MVNQKVQALLAKHAARDHQNGTTTVELHHEKLRQRVRGNNPA